MICYSSKGHPIAYSEDQKILYLFSGKPVAYLHGELLYAFNGTLLGRYEKGWVRDLKGYCVFFTDETSLGGPALPVKCAIPAKCTKLALPAKKGMEVSHAKNADHSAWSELSGEEFFDQ